jgi:hypothetical protein
VARLPGLHLARPKEAFQSRKEGTPRKTKENQIQKEGKSRKKEGTTNRKERKSRQKEGKARKTKEPAIEFSLYFSMS